MLLRLLLELIVKVRIAKLVVSVVACCTKALLICLMVVVRAGAIVVREITSTVVVVVAVAVGISSKETSGHVVPEILTAIVATTTECFVKCTVRNVETQLIPIRNTIVIAKAVPL